MHGQNFKELDDELDMQWEKSKTCDAKNILIIF